MSLHDEKVPFWHSDGVKVYADSDYSYEDAELLAQLWDIPITEAKQAIGHKIIHKIEDLLPQKVSDQYARRMNEGDGDYHYDGDNDQKAFTAFADSDYHYEDAELLARIWGIKVNDAKSAIGYKILHKAEHTLPEEVRVGRFSEGEEICSELSPEDSVLSVRKSPVSIDLSNATINITSIKIREINIYNEDMDDD